MTSSNIAAPYPATTARKRLQAAAGLCVLLTAAGCAAFGGNVKGNFACQAPNGICAPTTKIDDQALAAMGAQDGGSMQPASRISQATAHSPTALKVVLPARRDRFGRWREASIVYIEPDLAVATTTGDEVTIGAPRLSLSDLAAGAPEMALLQTPRPAATAAEMKAQVDAVLGNAKRPVSAGAASVTPSVAVVAANAATPAAGGPQVVSAPKFAVPGPEGDF